MFELGNGCHVRKVLYWKEKGKGKGKGKVKGKKRK
jgi:hypothetical protein